MAVFEGGNSSNDIINNGGMSYAEEVASDLTPVALLLTFLQRLPFVIFVVRAQAQR